MKDINQLLLNILVYGTFFVVIPIGVILALLWPILQVVAILKYIFE